MEPCSSSIRLSRQLLPSRSTTWAAEIGTNQVQSTPKNQFTSICTAMKNFAQCKFDTIHFQDWEFRKVSYYTLLSGFRPPWPPSNCPQLPTLLDSRQVVYSGMNNVKDVSSSPNLLTKSGPLECRRLSEKPFQSLKCKRFIRSTSFIFIFTRPTCNSSSYPEGNFNWNQQPGDSMSLSPLSSPLSSDLHVSITSTFHGNFSPPQHRHA